MVDSENIEDSDDASISAWRKAWAKKDKAKKQREYYRKYVSRRV